MKWTILWLYDALKTKDISNKMDRKLMDRKVCMPLGFFFLPVIMNILTFPTTDHTWTDRNFYFWYFQNWRPIQPQISFWKQLKDIQVSRIRHTNLCSSSLLSQTFKKTSSTTPCWWYLDSLFHIFLMWTYFDLFPLSFPSLFLIPIPSIFDEVCDIYA